MEDNTDPFTFEPISVAAEKLVIELAAIRYCVRRHPNKCGGLAVPRSTLPQDRHICADDETHDRGQFTNSSRFFLAPRTGKRVRVGGGIDTPASSETFPEKGGRLPTGKTAPKSREGNDRLPFQRIPHMTCGTDLQAQERRQPARS
jgi:hypothetical protein